MFQSYPLVKNLLVMILLLVDPAGQQVKWVGMDGPKARHLKLV